MTNADKSSHKASLVLYDVTKLGNEVFIISWGDWIQP